MKFRPSSLPQLSACRQFVANPAGSDAARAGQLRHEVLASLLTRPKEEKAQHLSRLPEEHRAGVEWAFEYIMVNADTSQHPLESEQLRQWYGPDLEERQGTLDVICGNVLFDLKWNVYDYVAQMADYACALLKEYPEVICHLLFAESQTSKVVTFRIDEAHRIVGTILDTAGTGAPTPCRYCGWCKKFTTCAPIVQQANVIVKAHPDWGIGPLRYEDLNTPAEIGNALTISRNISKWCEAVEARAKELAESGTVATGFNYNERQGNRFINSVQAAYTKTRLDQGLFLATCEIKLSSLVEAFAKQTGLSKAAAERDLVARLGDTIERKQSTMSLVKIK